MKTNKPLSILLVFAMIVGLLPWAAMPAQADSENRCGENVVWELTNLPNDEMKLTVTGTGDMYGEETYTSNTKIPWYNERKKIAEVVVGGGVTSVAPYLCNGCNKLTSVSLPDSVTRIERGAFANCSELTDLTLPAKLKSIGNYAFGSCIALNSLTFPTTLESIGENTFNDCRSFIDIKLPDSVTSIGAKAFINCGSLQSIKLPKDLTAIPDQMFNCCSDLQSINIPAGVTSIGKDAFSGCTNKLTEITLPAGLESVDGSAFSNCYKLERILISDAAKNYSSAGGVLFNKAGTELVAFPGGYGAGYTVPEGVAAIGTSAFRANNALEQVTLPDSLKTIGDCAFQDAGKLRSIELPQKLASLGDSAFNRCGKLERVLVPKSVTSMGESVFSGCDELVSATILAPIETLPKRTFSYSRSLESAVLPASVTRIGESAFYNCGALKNVYYGGAEWNVTVESGNDPLKTAKVTCNYTPATPPKPAAPTASYANGEVALSWESVEGDGIVYSVARRAYDDANEKWEDWSTIARNLAQTSCTDAGTRPGTLYQYRVTACGSGGTGEPSEPAELSTPLDTGKCGENLTWVLGRDGALTVSGNGAMNDYGGFLSIPWSGNSDNVKTVVLKGGVTSVGARAFCYCRKLESVTLPEGVTSIGNEAFEGCEELRSIKLPDSVAGIGQGAFNGCAALTKFTVGSNNKNYSAKGGVLFNKNKTVLINYPAGRTAESYVVPESVTEISACAFIGCGYLREVTLPKDLKSVGKGAFIGCAALGAISIPSGVQRIEPETFLECDALADVTIPAGIGFIADSAFENCPELAHVYFGGDSAAWSKLDVDGTAMDSALVYFECDGPVATAFKTASVSGRKLTCTLSNAPKGALLVAAWYDAKGRLLGVTTLSAPFGKTARASGVAVGVGAEYRLMLLDPRTAAPLCAAWDSGDR